ncbi:MAG: hypothetical protein MUO33_06695, partial [Sedimentisphaerales bacterium]|nr:hypothetical protein [Sedimentisphaerales bacterium]
KPQAAKAGQAVERRSSTQAISTWAAKCTARRAWQFLHSIWAIWRYAEHTLHRYIGGGLTLARAVAIALSRRRLVSAKIGTPAGSLTGRAEAGVNRSRVSQLLHTFYPRNVLRGFRFATVG